MNQLSTRVRGKAARLGKMWTEGLLREKSKKSQGKRKASFTSESATKRPKWSWASEAVEILLKYINEFKMKYKFNGVDFEADLSTMHTEIRRCMAVDFLGDFGPEIIQEPGKELQDMNSEEYEFYRKEMEEQKRQIRKYFASPPAVSLWAKFL